MLSVKFIIDYNDKVQRKTIDGPKKSADDGAKAPTPAPIQKVEARSSPAKEPSPATAAAAPPNDKPEPGKNTAHNKQITQLMNYQGFSNKKRVHKMIKKIEEQQENKIKKVGLENQSTGKKDVEEKH